MIVQYFFPVQHIVSVAALELGISPVEEESSEW